MNRTIVTDLIPVIAQPKIDARVGHAAAAPASHHLLGVAEDVIVCLSLVAMILLGLVCIDIATGGSEASAPVVADVAGPGR